jgi:hypothetical protein
MSPVNLVAGYQQKVDFAPTILIRTCGLISHRIVNYVGNHFSQE